MRVLLHGAKGVMGQNVQEVAKQTEGMEIVAGLDSHTDLNHPGFPVYGSGAEVKEDFDCIIDFSVKEAVDALLDFAVKKKKPLVLCTTGLSEAQEKKLQDASKQIPVLRSGNMSLGINLLQELLRIAAKKLYENGFDAGKGCRRGNRRKLGDGL